jgi:hypothetical protein
MNLTPYTLKVPGEIRSAYPLYEEQQADVWHSDGESVYVASYSFKGTSFDIYCSGKMRWHVKNGDTYDVWRSASDISSDITTDAELSALMNNDSLVTVDNNCWFEAYIVGEYDSDTNLIDGDLDSIIAQCHDVASRLHPVI